MCRRGRKGRDGIARGNAREGGREFVTTVKLLLHSKSRMKNKWKLNTYHRRVFISKISKISNVYIYLLYSFQNFI